MCTLYVTEFGRKFYKIFQCQRVNLFYTCKNFVFVFCFFVKHKCSTCFSCFLGLLYTLLLVFYTSLQPNKFWHQKHIPQFVMGEVPVSHKEGNNNGLYSGLSSTLFKTYALNKQQVQGQ
jgi:hypothetical protein